MNGLSFDMPASDADILSVHEAAPLRVRSRLEELHGRFAPHRFQLLPYGDRQHVRPDKLPDSRLRGSQHH
jgi:hypothetical protein